VHVQIGPLPAAGAKAWIERARQLLDLVPKIEGLAFVVPTEVLAELDDDLAGWQLAAEHDPFVWSREVDALTLRTRLTYWLNLTQSLVDVTAPRSAPESETFYLAVVDALLDALATEDPDGAAALRARWPRPGATRRGG
jgi:hypothetical protein